MYRCPRGLHRGESMKAEIHPARLYGKMVRDNIPTIIEERGQRPIYRTIGEDELELRFNLKLKEELDEVVQAQTHEHKLEELADLLEVIYGYVDHLYIVRSELERVRLAKFEKRGGYDKHHFLVSVEEPLTEEEVKEREEAEFLERMMANPKFKGTELYIKEKLDERNTIVIDATSK